VIPDPSPRSGLSRLGQLIVLALVMGTALTMVWWPGCRQFPPVTSPEALTLIKLVHTACNTRDSARLEAAAKRWETLLQSGKASSREKEAFDRIFQLAKQGDWQAAEDLSFRFAQDQVGQGSSPP